MKARYPFTKKMIDGAPRDAGVYVSYQPRSRELPREQREATGALPPCNCHSA